MATRSLFTLDDVLGELDRNEEYEDDSEDDFDGYVEMDEIEGANVGANVEINNDSSECPVTINWNRAARLKIVQRNFITVTHIFIKTVH